MNITILLLCLINFFLIFYIKCHLPLKTHSSERKWYEKIRFVLPLLLIPVFTVIYCIWAYYPNYLEHTDTKTTASSGFSTTELPWTIEEIYTNHSNSNSDEVSRLQVLGEKYSAYGDAYGSLNTLFTGFAFAGLIISIFIQLIELRQTRKELSGQKLELSAQTTILNRQTQITENQQKIIDKQFKENQKENFLTNFFKLIDQKNVLLNRVYIVNKENIIVYGNNVFTEYVIHFRKHRSSFDPKKHDHTYMKELWDNFNKSKYGSYNYQLQSYFKIYRVIFRFINSSGVLTSAEKKYYMDIVNTLMLAEERVILMWVSTFDHSLKTYCNKFQLLKGIYNKDLEKIALQFFELSAFGDSVEWKRVFDENKQTTDQEVTL